MRLPVFNIPLQFDKVRRITPDNWLGTDWYNTASPGDILLLKNCVTTSGGLLHVGSGPLFLLLTSDQVWLEALISWPVPTTVLRALRLKGSKVSLVK